MKAKEFKEAVSRAANATALGGGESVLDLVCIKKSSLESPVDLIEITGTDGSWLVTSAVPYAWKIAGGDLCFLPSKENMAKIRKLSGVITGIFLDKSEEEIVISTDTHLPVRVSGGRKEYPRYQALFPELISMKSISFDRKRMLDMVMRVIKDDTRYAVEIEQAEKAVQTAQEARKLAEVIFKRVKDKTPRKGRTQYQMIAYENAKCSFHQAKDKHIEAKKSLSEFTSLKTGFPVVDIREKTVSSSKGEYSAFFASGLEIPEIRFNAKMLAAYLRGCKNDHITMYYTGADRAAIFTDRSTTRALIMPVVNR